jgi:hypothetical protein
MTGIDSLALLAKDSVAAADTAKNVIQELLKSYSQGGLLVMGLAFIGGLAGGVVARLLANDDGLPGKGWPGAIFGGGLAAVASLAVSIPAEFVRFVGQCLIAGYAGKTMLEAMKTKAVAALRQERLSATERVLKLARGRAESVGTVLAAQRVSPPVELKYLTDDIDAALVLVEKK